jgi:hypothetical protein
MSAHQFAATAELAAKKLTAIDVVREAKQLWAGIDVAPVFELGYVTYEAGSPTAWTRVKTLYQHHEVVHGHGDA